jgi:hypothetical protein
MKYLLAKDSEHDYFVVIEPGVCFGGYGADDRIQVKVTDAGWLDVTMDTTCCRCSEPMSIRFFLDSNIPAETSWSYRSVRCEKCNVLQLKKIRYYAKENSHMAQQKEE